MPQESESRKLDQYIVRFPDGMRERLKEAAKANGRSMNAEIVSRLERYPSLAGELGAIEAVARAMAEAIDESIGEDPFLLMDKVGDVFSSVTEDGDVDTARLYRDWFADVFRRLEGASAGTFHISDELLQRVRVQAEKNMRTAEAEILSTLEREYPPATDVMHIHLHNIRRALDLYEKETDPRMRLQLQQKVEAMVTLGHAFEIEFDDEYPEAMDDDGPNNPNTWELLRPFIVDRDPSVLDALANGNLNAAVDAARSKKAKRA